MYKRRTGCEECAVRLLGVPPPQHDDLGLASSAVDAPWGAGRRRRAHGGAEPAHIKRTRQLTPKRGLTSASGRLWWRKRRRTGELQPPSRRPQLVGATTHLASAPTAPATGRGPRWVSARSWAQSGGRTCSTCSKSNFSARLRLTETAQVRARGAAGADPDSWTRRPSTAQSVFGTFCLVSSSL